MTLMARYSGECPECGERWSAGDLIRADEDKAWKHAVCPTPRPTAAPCASCFQIPAANGACGCDPIDSKDS
ncbi:conserved hypothetical protein [Aeromicrobium sp. 9AM]|nr:conserved hypothetical protein [Aeromicrobium sp. 9AM]